MVPSSTRSEETGAPSFAAAVSSRMPRASALAKRSADPDSPLDRTDDPVMRPATAEVARERLPDLGLAGMRGLVEQRLGRHQHARDAVAALGCLLVDEGLLQRMQLGWRSETFEGRDLRIHH